MSGCVAHPLRPSHHHTGWLRTGWSLTDMRTHRRHHSLQEITHPFGPPKHFRPPWRQTQMNMHKLTVRACLPGPLQAAYTSPQSPRQRASTCPFCPLSTTLADEMPTLRASISCVSGSGTACFWRSMWLMPFCRSSPAPPCRYRVATRGHGSRTLFHRLDGPRPRRRRAAFRPRTRLRPGAHAQSRS